MTSAPTGASTGLGGDMQTKKPKKPADDAQAKPATDGLEPPPEVLPAAPSLGKIGDAAALPTIDAGVARNDAMDRMKALEKTRREIDSSMRTGSKQARYTTRPASTSAVVTSFTPRRSQSLRSAALLSGWMARVASVTR